MNKINLNITEEENEILLKRTENLSQVVKLTEEKADNKISYLTFKINDISYAIEQSYIQELHMDVYPKKMPCVPNFIKGIINIRGDILSVTDLSLFLGNKPIEKKQSYQMLRLKKKSIEFGVIVDSIEEMISLGEDDIHHFASSENNKIGKYLKGVGRDMTNILNAELIMSDESIIVNNNNS